MVSGAGGATVLTCVCAWVATDPDRLHSLTARLRLLGAFLRVDGATRDVVRGMALPMLCAREVDPTVLRWFETVEKPTPQSLMARSDRRIVRLEAELCTRPLPQGAPNASPPDDAYAHADTRPPPSHGALECKPRRAAVDRLLALAAAPALWALVPLKAELRSRRTVRITGAEAWSKLRLKVSGSRSYSYEDCLDASRKLHGTWDALQRRTDAALERSAKAAQSRRVNAERREAMRELWRAHLRGSGASESAATADDTAVALCPRSLAARCCEEWDVLVSSSVVVSAAARRFVRSGRPAHLDEVVSAARVAHGGVLQRARWIEDALRADEAGDAAMLRPLSERRGGVRWQLMPPRLMQAIDEHALFAGDEDRATIERAAARWRWALALWADWRSELVGTGGREEGEQPQQQPQAASPLDCPLVIDSVRALLESAVAVAVAAEGESGCMDPSEEQATRVRHWWRVSAGAFRAHNAQLPGRAHWSRVDEPMFVHAMAEARVIPDPGAQPSRASHMVHRAVRTLRRRAFELAQLHMPQPCRRGSAERERLRSAVRTVLSSADAKGACLPMSEAARLAASAAACADDAECGVTTP